MQTPALCPPSCHDPTSGNSEPPGSLPHTPTLFRSPVLGAELSRETPEGAGYSQGGPEPTVNAHQEDEWQRWASSRHRATAGDTAPRQRPCPLSGRQLLMQRSAAPLPFIKPFLTGTGAAGNGEDRPPNPGATHSATQLPGIPALKCKFITERCVGPCFRGGAAIHSLVTEEWRPSTRRPPPRADTECA